MLETTRTADQTALRSAPIAAAVAALKKERFLYIDNLRLVMIIFVVMIHTAVTYSGLGSWYYKEGAQLDALSMFLFGLPQAFTQAYFMGLLFLVAGYFVPGAFDKKGFRRFINDRLVRLGIPALIYMLVIHPFILYTLLDLSWVRPKPGIASFYANYITSLDFAGGSGPLWFAIALLLFSLVYGLLRLFSRKPVKPAEETKITHIQVIGLIALVSAAAFCIRLILPVGTSVVNMQLCNFAQYIALFSLGIQAYRRQWLNRTPAAFGMRWLTLTLIASPLIFLAIILGGGALDNGLDAYNGGWNWQSAAYALWETFTGIGLSIGLLTFFREKLNHQSRLVKILSDNSFAVYVFHAPVLIAIALLLQPLVLHPLAKFFLVAPLAVIATFALTYFVLRRIPLLKKVI
jgi:glucans biosynthesis protein C